MTGCLEGEQVFVFNLSKLSCREFKPFVPTLLALNSTFSLSTERWAHSWQKLDKRAAGETLSNSWSRLLEWVAAKILPPSCFFPRRTRVILLHSTAALWPWLCRASQWRRCVTRRGNQRRRIWHQFPPERSEIRPSRRCRRWAFMPVCISVFMHFSTSSICGFLEASWHSSVFPQ